MSGYPAPPAPGPAGTPQAPPGRGRRRARWLWSGAVLVLVAAVLAALALTRHDGTPAATAPAGAGRPPAMARSVPERIEIPSIGVDSRVEALGLAADGTVEVPPIEADSPVGWYDGSPTPGETGASVLLGHVTVGSLGKSVFYRLHELRPGARIETVRADGSTAVFTVTKSEVYPKSRFPSQAVYGATGTPQLRLVTCAVPAGTTVGSGYLDNLVVYADLTSTTP
ncbi:class F sortase [Streptomyces sp. NPDC089919]|uniref:class F sortase n=1 Tax=Streptomyces sp. NPDC089919 TaxID=3155188 RepID=UPI0034342BC7